MRITISVYVYIVLQQNELFAAFKDWIHEQKEEKHDDKEDFKEYMKQHAMNYRKYKDLKVSVISNLYVGSMNLNRHPILR